MGGTGFIYYVSTTLQDNLNDQPKFNNDTVNSPDAGTPNWQVQSTYKVLVNQDIFGVYGIGSVAVKKNCLAATKTSYSGKCGYPRSTTYTPCIYSDIINSTAYLCAQVCGCSTAVHAKACLSVKLSGPDRPGCNNQSGHDCQKPVHCSCDCAQCQAGNHGNCTNTVKIGWYVRSMPSGSCTPVGW